MGKNKIRDLLRVSVPSPKRSTFDRSHTNPITADVGYIYPVLVDELLPTDYVKLDLMAFAQTNPLTKPLLGRFTLKFEAFFVPLRLYCQNLDLNNLQPNFSDDFNLPYFHVPDGIDTLFTPEEDFLYMSGTNLLSYLNMFPFDFDSEVGIAFDKLNGVPFVGYFDIYRNYYANPHDRLIPFRVGRKPSTGTISYDVQDYYFPLETFDEFVTSCTLNSIDEENLPQPVGVNVSERFREIFRNTATGVNSTSNPPLFNGQLWSPTNSTTPAAETRNALHLGLLRRTYNDDYFTAFFSNDYVNYQESTAKVTVNNNVVTVNQLRLANRVAKFVDRSMLAGTRYGDWLEVHFGSKTNTRLCIPQFLGSLRVPLVFNDVVSQSQTGTPTSVNDNTSLGSRGSLGQGFKDFNRKGHWLRFEAKEHGYLMIMASIVPDVCYIRGIPKMYHKTRFADFYTPEFDAVGYQDLGRSEFWATGQNNAALAKQPSWFEYMVDYNKAHGLFCDLEDYRQWILARDPAYSSWSGTGSSSFRSEFSTYILPEMFNQVFAVQKEMDNFQIQLRFDYKIKRPISKQVLPHL